MILFKSRKNDVTKHRTRNSIHRTYSDSRLYSTVSINSGGISLSSCLGAILAGPDEALLGPKATGLQGRFLSG